MPAKSKSQQRLRPSRFFYRPSWFTEEVEDLLNAYAEDRDYDINIKNGPILKYDKGKPISFKFPDQPSWVDFTPSGWWKHYLRGRNLQSTPPPSPNRESSLQLIKKRNAIA